MKVLAIALTATAIAAVGGATPALAAFPGANGEILFNSSEGGSQALDPNTGALRALTGDSISGAPNVAADGTLTMALFDIVSVDPTRRFSTEIDIGLSADIAYPVNNGAQYLFENSDDLYLVDSSGLNAHRVVDTSGDLDARPTLSPTSARVAYGSDGSGDRWDLYSSNVDGSGAQQLTATTQDEWPTSWSPDGSRLLFDRFLGDPVDVYSVSATGGGEAPVLVGPANDRGAVYSPDGTAMAFISDRDDARGEIYVSDLAGGGARRLTFNASFEGRLFWATPPIAAPSSKCGGKNVTVAGDYLDNTLRGTKKRDVIAGFDGDDRILGLKGNDIVCGGDGDDDLFGGPGKDLLRGDAGFDECTGGGSKDKAKSCDLKSSL